jgi:hypothetical protein
MTVNALNYVKIEFARAQELKNWNQFVARGRGCQSWFSFVFNRTVIEREYANNSGVF